MILQALEPQDAEEIAALARHHYPEEMALEASEIADSLSAAEEEGGNFSLGLLDHGQLRAYMLAWLEESRVEGLRESVVLIDDLTVATGALSDLQKLFRSLVGNLEDSGLSHLAIEGTVLPETRDTLLGQQRFFSSLGYELVASRDYFEEEIGVELTWVRYERPVEVEASAASEGWDGSEFEPEEEELEVVEDEELEEFPD